MAKNIANQTKEKIQKLFDKAKEYIDNSKTEQKGVELLIELMQTSLREHAIFELCMLNIKNNNFKQAQICFDAIEKIPNSKYIPRVKIEKGRIFAKSNQIDEAIQCYMEATEIGNQIDYFYANFELGKLYAEMNNNEAAKECFQNSIKIVNINIDVALAQYELGKLYVNEGNDEEAKRCFEEIVSTDSKTKVNSILELGKLYTREGNLELAKRLFTGIIDKNNHAIERLIFLAIKANNLPEASRLLNNLSPTIENYEDIKSYILYKTGRKDEITTDSYFTSQLFEYKRERAIAHIQRHLYDNTLRRKHTVFNSNVDINALFDEVKSKIENSHPVDTTNVERYIIYCDDNVATINGEETNCVVVLTIPYTENIITIYPIKPIKKAKSKQLSIGSLDR